MDMRTTDVTEDYTTTVSSGGRNVAREISLNTDSGINLAKRGMSMANKI